jgi:sugar-specific transcriptional regulator TrmB
MNEQVTEQLQTLGFTQLESEIYLHLLKNGICTGYSIGKGINKPVANVYKALDSLGQKGGVVSASSKNKKFGAVDWRTLLENHKKRFDNTLEQLSEQLESIVQPDIDEQIYQVNNCDQVIETAIKMINEAQSMVLADIEPEALPLLSSALVEAAERGVEVRVRLYQDETLPGVTTVLRRHGSPIHEKADDVAFSASCDGSQFIIAMLSKDKRRVIQAFQSQSVLMSMTMHTQILYGQVLTDLKDYVNNDELEKAKTVLAETEHLHPLSAENTVFQRYKARYNI